MSQIAREYPDEPERWYPFGTKPLFRVVTEDDFSRRINAAIGQPNKVQAQISAALKSGEPPRAK